MTSLLINSISGITLPFNLFVCDVYGNQCIFTSTVNTSIPPAIQINLPIQYNIAPAMMLKIIDALGCEKTGIIYCSSNGKIFQSGEIFIFMDSDIYLFEDQ